jgi:hypothetical protein
VVPIIQAQIDAARIDGARIGPAPAGG